MPGQGSSQWTVKQARKLAEGVIENAIHGTKEAIDDTLSGLGVEHARRGQPHPVA